MSSRIFRLPALTLNLLIRESAFFEVLAIVSCAYEGAPLFDNATQRAGVMVLVDAIMEASAVAKRQHQVTQGPRNPDRICQP